MYFTMATPGACRGTGLNGMMLVWLSLFLVFGNARDVSREEYMEPKGHLLLPSEHTVKTIKTEYGDIFDCVDIYKQPAFDNPLLKNHKIQMRPSFFPKGGRVEHLPDEFEVRMRHLDCPEGTVPIRRTNLDPSKLMEINRNKGLPP